MNVSIRSASTALALIVAVAISSIARAQDFSIAVTADTSGHLTACRQCPATVGEGGLDRRATIVASLRKQAPLLLVDAGNALFGDESAENGGRAIVDAYALLGYDALNISYRDFREGKAATIALLAGSPFAVSCNIVDPSSGKPLFKPYIVKTIAGQKWAMIGVTQRPAALETLDELKRQLDGVRIDPPVDALATWLPKASAEAQSVLLLYYGTPAGLNPLLSRFGKSIAAVAIGGARPEQLSARSIPPIIASDRHGTSLGQLKPGTGDIKVGQIRVTPSIESDAAMQKLLAPAIAKMAPITLAPSSSGAPSAMDATVKPPNTNGAGANGAAANGAAALASLPPDGVKSITLTANNTSVELAIKSVAVLGKIGDAEPQTGSKFIVVDVSFRNIQTAQKVDDQTVPVQYKIPKLADHLYAVGNGRTVLPHVEPSVAGLLSFDELSLEKENDTAGGKIIYQVPADQLPRELTLRFYDFAHGHIIARLVGGPVPIEDKPLAAPLKNQVVEAAVFGIRKVDKLGDQAAPQGMSYVLVDLRARSLMSEQVDASTYKPLAKPGEKMTLGTVADWKESRKYAQLVVDGQYAYMPLAQSDLAEEPRFLPDIMTGGTLAFLAPADAKSIELRCDFPNAALPDGKIVRPDGLTLPIEGKPPALALPASIASAKDEAFAVSIVGESSPPSFAGASPDDGQRLLVIDVAVKNNGNKQEFFQSKKQLKHVAESGAQSDVDDLTFKGPHQPPELIYIPPGQVRSFQLVYRIAAAETRPRLMYAAVTEGASAVLTLKPLPKAAAPGNPPSAKATRKDGLPPAHSDLCTLTDDEDAVPLKPRAHGPAKGLEGVGLTAERVNAAIDKGCAGLWTVLKKEMADDQSEFGAKREHILCALALVHGGFHKKNTDFNSMLRGYLSSADLSPDFGIYRTGILCMLIEAYGEPAFEPKLRKAARWLLESQMNTGTWIYTPDVPDSVFAPVAPTGAIQISGGLPPGKRAEPWKRMMPAAEGDGDNSVTQYGLLGMLSASRTGIRFDDDIWKRVMKTTRDRQDDDGGWAYSGKSNSYGSMTCAGICALAICRHELGEKNPADDPAIEHGLAWLDKSFKAGEHPGHPNEWYFYYMYSLERVGRILDTEFIGVNEWYPLGAASLVGQQKDDGTWAAQEGDETDPRLATSFALLFLTRATPPLKPVVHTGPGVLRTAAIAPSNQFYIILDASGSMIAMMDGKRKFDIARDSIRSLIAQLPANCDVALRVYGHRKTAIDEGADEDIELKIPMGKLDKKQFNAVLDTLRARGRTPLALSLDQAAADLGDATAARPVTVLLLTDGGEDTINPRGNPIKSATDFGKIPNTRLHIVGFDINQPNWSAQLQNMAKASHGSYWPAAKASDLERTVRTAVLGLPDEYVVFDDSGKEVARGRFGQTQQLPEGKYKFQARFAGRDIGEEFWIDAGEPTDITFDASQLPPAKP